MKKHTRVLVLLAGLLPLLAQGQIPLQQSTASQAVKFGPFVDSTDGNTEKTALTIANTDVKLSKAGGTIANKNSGGCTHDANGWYTCTLDATDTATAGRLTAYIHVSGALPVFREFMVYPTANYAALFSTAPGAANGLLIAGNNTATTFTGVAASGATPATAGITLVGGAASTTGGGVAAPGLASTGGAGAASTNGAADGIKSTGGGTTTVAGGNGLALVATGNLNGMSATGAGTGNGILGTSGSGATGNGMQLTSAATNGSGMGVTGNGTGTGINGTLATVTTATTATNLTNAPTNGDFTATMKTSIGTAVAASAVASVTGNVGGNVTGSVGSVTSVSSGAITEASFATTAGSFAPLQIVDQGTAQAATGTTLQLRSAAAFADSELIGSYVYITGGSAGVGQVRQITAYTGATDTATVATWTTTPTGTITYKILAAPASSGSVSIAAGGITSASFASGAIDANAIATDAIGAAEIAASAIGASELAADAITAAKIADGAIDPATFSTTAGAFNPLLITDQGTAQAATATTLQLRSADTFADSELVGATVCITGGSAGVGQCRIISAYTGSTDTATVPNWTTTPTGTITYQIIQTAPGVGGSVSISAGGITASSFASGAIDANAIAANAIGASEIADGAIDAATFATGAIDAAAIATDAIGAAEIAANAIGAAEIADNALDAATFDTTAGSYSPLGIVDQGTAQSASSTTIVLRSAATFADSELVGATVVITGGSAGVGQARTCTAYVGSTDTCTVTAWTTTPTGTITYKVYGTAAGTVTVGPVTVATGGITAASFANDSITAAAIAADAIGASEIATDAIGAAEIAADAIGASEIATDAIGAAEIAASAIGSSELAANAIGASQIASGAITNAKFAAGAIDSTAVAASAIGASQIATGAITAAKFAASAIDAAAIADGAIDSATFATTAGSFPSLNIVDQGTAQAATATTLQLRSAAAFANDELLGLHVLITGGSAGVGQVREITDYDGPSDTATVAAWTTTPTGTITYKVFGAVAAASGGGGLDASGVRAAIGLASANLDVQLGAIDDYVDTEVAAIKAKTDQLTFTTANQVDSNALAITAGAISTASFSAGAINAAAIGADAITAAKIANGAIDAATFAAGAIDATAIATDAIGAAEIADAAIDANTFAANSITAGAIAANAITSAKIATDAIGAAQIATDAIGSAEVAATAVTEIQSGLSTLDAAAVRSAVGLGSANLDTQLSAIDDYVDTEVAAILGATVLQSGLTADSGSTTTIVDAALTQSANDYWKGAAVVITSGSTAGETRCVTAFTAATDTLTVKPAFTAAISTNTYLLVRDTNCNGVAP